MRRSGPLLSTTGYTKVVQLKNARTDGGI
eukprot:SAG11_NODE_27446_length_332_cov_1.506438_1_plen_28_part_10